MATKPKIKLLDDTDLRNEIDKVYESTDQLLLAKWAIGCARHVLHLAIDEKVDLSVIERSFAINALWQTGSASVHEVRQAGFSIHAVARTCKTEVGKNAIRTAGQAVAVGHMSAHAMVCSDYAVKTIGLAYPKNLELIKKERQWQLAALLNLTQSV